MPSLSQFVSSLTHMAGSWFRYAYYGGRYLLLTPAWRAGQVVYDRKTSKLSKVVIRDKIDFGTFHEIFLTEGYSLERLARHPEIQAYYETVVASGRTPLIIDCGGNIGLAARYFAENFSAARIVCIEPEAANIALARRNNVSGNIDFLHCAVGSRPGRGAIIDPALGNNAFRIEASPDGGTEILSINHLLARYGTQYSPFIVKIDIEGFENELFSEHTEWVDKFPLLIVELHDWMLPRQGTTRNFLKTVAPLDRDFVFRGENVFSISNTLL